MPNIAVGINISTPINARRAGGGGGGSSYPDATNTGVPSGWTPTNTVNGTLNLNVAGVYENYLVNGKVIISAENVTFKNSKVVVQTLGDMGVDIWELNCTVQNVEVDGNSQCKNGIQGLGVITKNNIHHCENGMNIATQFTNTITDNFIHTLFYNGDAHYDGIAMQGSPGAAGPVTLIQHNTIIARDTSCIFIKNDFGPIYNVTINNNYMLGDPAATPPRPSNAVHINSTGLNGGAITGVSITNNKLVQGETGYLFISNDLTVTVSGNVDSTTGNPAP